MVQRVHSLTLKRNTLREGIERVPQSPKEIFHYLGFLNFRKIFGYYSYTSYSNLNYSQSSCTHWCQKMPVVSSMLKCVMAESCYSMISTSSLD